MATTYVQGLPCPHCRVPVKPGQTDGWNGWCTNPECVKPIRLVGNPQKDGEKWVKRDADQDDFGGINTAPSHPIHVEQVLNHIAHLEDDQIDRIRTILNEWTT